MFRQVLANCYEEARSQMTVMLSGVGLIAPQLLDLRWKLELIEQVSHQNNVKLMVQLILLSFRVLCPRLSG